MCLHYPDFVFSDLWRIIKTQPCCRVPTDRLYMKCFFAHKKHSLSDLYIIVQCTFCVNDFFYDFSMKLCRLLHQLIFNISVISLNSLVKSHTLFQSLSIHALVQSVLPLSDPFSLISPEYPPVRFSQFPHQTAFPQ